MSQQGDPHKRQEDDWWRQLYDEAAGAGSSSAAGSDSIDEHFDSALTAMDRRPAPSPAADTLRLRRPTPPPPPPSWPRPTRTGAPRPGERSPAGGAAEEQAAGPAARAVEPPPWDAWAARPMFPTQGGEAGPAPEERADEAHPASSRWTEAPSAAEPWSPTPRPPARPPAAAPPDAVPRPAEPWTSPGPDSRTGGRHEPDAPSAEDEPGALPAEPPEDFAPAPVRPPVEPDPYVSRTAWPPLGRTPEEPEVAGGPSVSEVEPERRASASPDPAPVESSPYAPSGVWPPLGRSSEEPGPELGAEPDASAVEPVEGPQPSVPSAPPRAWPPLGRLSGEPGPVPVSGQESGEPGPYASPAPWPAGSPGAEPDVSAAESRPEPGVPDTPDPRVAGGETAFGEGGVRWAPELPPGWVPADEEGDGEGEPAAAVVGGGPPTYAAEPTAWPEADPDRLDGLVPDTVLDGARYGSLTLRTASVRGDSARYRGQPRRDAVLTARFGAGDDALLLVATATGARAADDAHRAAQDAVRWIAGAVGRSRERLAGDLGAARRGSLKSGLHRLTDRCYGRLRARGEDLGLEEGEYTASLRCLLLPADPECRIRLFFGVGAGGLFRIRSGAWQDLDIAPDDAAAPFRFRATLAQPGDALLMCSAGLADPLRGEPALAARLAERWGDGRVPGLPGYLADVQTRVKGYADDRTAVTVWDA